MPVKSTFQNIIISLFLLISFTSEKSDISFHYYYLKGNVTGIENLADLELLIIQGNFKKIVKTDSYGNFNIKMRYLKPCISGGGVGKGYKDPFYLNLAESYNGSELYVYLPSKSSYIKLKQTWKNYYMGDKVHKEKTIIDFNFKNATLITESKQNSKTQQLIINTLNVLKSRK